MGKGLKAATAYASKPALDAALGATSDGGLQGGRLPEDGTPMSPGTFLELQMGRC